MNIRHAAAALILILAATLAPAMTSPVLAQGVQSAPIAAPVGESAQSQPLAAPPGAATSTAPAGGADVLGSFSIVSMFLRADIIVKAVMILLILASLWSWTIIFNKIVTLSNLKRKAKRFEKLFWSGQSLDELYQQFAARNDHPLAAMFIAGLREWRRAFEGGAPRESMLPSVRERIDKAMSVTILRETDGVEKSLGMLATIGSVSPFVGLFGTVWGIMNSFSAIAARHDTTLAVVAPGIAEALFATAMGLLAAIPAVIFYNRFVADIGRYVNQLDAFADEFSAILSRQLDEKAR
jgi:biopolymer transport protein TolQ